MPPEGSQNQDVESRVSFHCWFLSIVSQRFTVSKHVFSWWLLSRALFSKNIFNPLSKQMAMSLVKENSSTLTIYYVKRTIQCIINFWILLPSCQYRFSFVPAGNTETVRKKSVYSSCLPCLPKLFTWLGGCFLSACMAEPAYDLLTFLCMLTMFVIFIASLCRVATLIRHKPLIKQYFTLNRRGAKFQLGPVDLWELQLFPR